MEQRRDPSGKGKTGRTLQNAHFRDGPFPSCVSRQKAEVHGGGSPHRGRTREGRTALAGWLIVCAVALLFTLYGFFAYFVIGDKGSPDWDYGSIPDLPAQSAYSTYPYRGEAKQPEPQHINRKPPVAKSGLQPDQIPSVPEPGPSKEQQP